MGTANNLCALIHIDNIIIFISITARNQAAWQLSCMRANKLGCHLLFDLYNDITN